MKRIILLLAVLLLCITAEAKTTFKFKFIYGLGANTDQKALIFYQLYDKSGQPKEKNPISKGDQEGLSIKIKKKNYSKIVFTGYFYSEETKKRKNLLKIEKNFNELQGGSSNSNNVQIIAAEVEDASFQPIAEVISALSQKRYESVLKPSKENLYNYDNVFPIGRFMLYNPETKESLDVFRMPRDSKPFVENARKIRDRYVLKKKAGLDLDVGYQRLASLTSTSEKQQYIEYVVNIDTLQILHWQSTQSETEFLRNQASSNAFESFTANFSDGSPWKFYFVSTCVKVDNMYLTSQTFDSLGTSNSANLDLGDAVGLKVKANVVYSLSEGSLNADTTIIYYTGFGARDYTSYAKNLIVSRTLDQQIAALEQEKMEASNSLLEAFSDFREVDSSILDFQNLDMITAFVNSLKLRETIEVIDTLSQEEKQKINDFNTLVPFYNVSLGVLNSKIDSYNNVKIDLEEKRRSKQNSTQPKAIIPNEIKIEDEVVGEAVASN